MYACARCGEEAIVEITSFGELTRSYMCSACGAGQAVKSQRTPAASWQAPSVATMTRRQMKVERELPPSAMELTLKHQKNMECRDDLISLLDELAD